MFSVFLVSTVAVVLAEMGNKTQLMTIALAAEQSVKAAGTGILHQFSHSLPAMMVADAFGIVVGIVFHKHIPERLVKWTAASGFAILGLLGMHDSLDGIVPRTFTLHHPALLLSVPVIAALMWGVARMNASNTTAPDAVPADECESSAP